jgi:hypothetical protein
LRKFFSFGNSLYICLVLLKHSQLLKFLDMKTKKLLSVLSRRQAVLQTAIARFLGVSLVCLCLVAQAWGQESRTVSEFEVEGIKYGTGTSDGIVAVIQKAEANGYSGDIVIPSTVDYEGKTYNVTSIGEEAFNDCIDLTSVAIPSSITSIGYAAFALCPYLTSVKVEWETPLIITNRVFKGITGVDHNIADFGRPFDTNYTNCKLIVPAGTEDLYRAAEGWQHFETITDGTEEPATEEPTEEEPATEEPVTEEPTEEEPATEEPTEEEPVTEEPTEEEPATEEPTEEDPATEEPTEEEPVTEEPTEEEPATEEPTEEEPVTEEPTEEDPETEEPALSVDTDTITFKEEVSLFKTIKITTKLDWEIITDADWISFAPKTSGTGSGEILVVAESNDGKERETTITVATEADSAYIYVSQASGIPSYALRFEAEKIYYYSPDTTLSTEVEVLAPDAGSYAGAVVIPSTATYSGKDYAVTAIGAEAFAASDLTKVTLPLSLTAVGEGAFKDCAALDSVEILWTTIAEAYPTGVIYSFDGVNLREVTLAVPAGMKDTYKSALFWGTFGTIVERERESSSSTAKATEAITVRATSGKLYVDTPAAETVYIYSFTGKLLYTATKASGAATFNAPSEKLLIVRGTSGWARKVIN